MVRTNAAPPLDAASPAARIVDNAFRVLGLTPRATWPEVARTAEALLAALAAGDPTVSSYDTPLGPQMRTADAVLVARARLRDPDERIQQEIWWEAPRRPVTRWNGPPALAHAHGPRPIDEAADGAADPWPQAPAAWGWRPR